MENAKQKVLAYSKVNKYSLFVLLLLLLLEKEQKNNSLFFHPLLPLWAVT